MLVRLILLAAAAAIAVAMLGVPASARAADSVVGASSGNDSELMKSIPIARRQWSNPQVAMTIPAGRLGEIRAGDRLEVNAEIEVSVCMKPNALHPGDGRPCIGKSYGYDPTFSAQLVLAPDSSTAAPGSVLAVSAVEKLRCTQSQPHRNHHCVLVVPPTRFDVENAKALPCGECAVNLVVSAHHPSAKGGHRLVLGSDEDDGGVNGDKGRLGAVKLRPNLLGVYPDPVLSDSNQPALSKLPIVAKGKETVKKVVASVPVDNLEVGDVLVIEATAVGKIGQHPYNVFLNSGINLALNPDTYQSDGAAYGSTDLHGQVTKGNGFNCTLGPSAHSDPCRVRKVGVVTVVKDPERELHANLAIGAMAIGTAPQYEKWRGGDGVKIKEASISVRRYRPDRLLGAP